MNPIRWEWTTRSGRRLTLVEPEEPSETEVSVLENEAAGAIRPVSTFNREPRPASAPAES